MTKAKTQKKNPLIPLLKGHEGHAEAIEDALNGVVAVIETYNKVIGDPPPSKPEMIVGGVIHLLEHPEMTPEESHNRWMYVRRKDGWEWGLEKGEADVKERNDAGTLVTVHKKTHPCMKPWADLPAEQQAKDVLFGAVVRAVFKRHKIHPFG